MALPAPGKLPKDTPIAALGFTKAQLSKMTPAARKLNKGDLIALQKWSSSGGKGSPPGHLKVADLQSLQKATGSPEAMVSRMRTQATADVTVCCCCCPCCTCTAAAEIIPVRLS